MAVRGIYGIPRRVNPKTAEMRNAIKATTNIIFAPEHVSATTPKPGSPAMRAMIRR